MEDILKHYYTMIDIYNKNFRDNLNYDDDSEDEKFFKLFNPICCCILMRYLEPIIKDICIRFETKEKAEKEIEKIKNLVESKGDNLSTDYKYKDITLIDLLKGEYNFLKNKFILKYQTVPDVNYYINNYTYPDAPITYPFSLKYMYHKILLRAINHIIDNYYNYKK